MGQTTPPRPSPHLSEDHSASEVEGLFDDLLDRVARVRVEVADATPGD